MLFGLTPFSATQIKGVDIHDDVGQFPRTFNPYYYYLKLQCYYFRSPKKQAAAMLEFYFPFKF